MTKKVRVSAGTLPELRDFLAGADVDMGCRPVAVKRGDRFATTVMSAEDELDRLSARRAGSVRIEVIGEVPSPAMRMRMAPAGNRFAGGRVPRGLGVKE
jgi:hypothetical protein